MAPLVYSVMSYKMAREDFLKQRERRNGRSEDEGSLVFLAELEVNLYGIGISPLTAPTHIGNALYITSAQQHISALPLESLAWESTKRPL